MRIVLPFLAGYYLSYILRAVNAVLGPVLAGEFGISAAGLGFLSLGHEVVDVLNVMMVGGVIRLATRIIRLA